MVFRGSYRNLLFQSAAVVSLISASILPTRGDEATPNPPSNQTVAESVAAAIAGGSAARSFQLEVTYIPGVVTLRGTVSDSADVTQIIDLVRAKLAGVQIVNHLAVGSPVIQAAAIQEPAPVPAPMVELGQPAAPNAAAQPPSSAAADAGNQLAPAAPQHTFMQRGATQYDAPYLPPFAWPAYAPYPNYSAVQYPRSYAANAWPYIGPFTPYPEVPQDWRSVKLRWNDGIWSLRFQKCWTVKFFERH